MTATITFTIHESALDDIIRKVSNDVDSAASRMVDVAKDLAPRDTGALAESIHKERGRDLQGDDFEVFVIANPSQSRAPNGYAIFPEFGTSRQRKQPYMIPALEAVIPGLQSDLSSQ